METNALIEMELLLTPKDAGMASKHDWTRIVDLDGTLPLLHLAEQAST
ncbi:hypothetical protein [Roseateles sp. P5_D6]